MIEALEIGISLALGDGVSEGVAAARRDLHAIDAAMTAGAVSVQRLRDVAAGVVSAPQAVVAGGEASGEKSARSVEPPTPAAAAPTSSATRVTQVAPPVAGPTVPPQWHSGPSPDAAPMAGAAPVSGAVALGSMAFAPPVQPPQAEPAPFYKALAMGIEPAKAPAEPAAPTITILRMESLAPSGAAPMPAGRDAQGSWTAAPPAGGSEAATAWSTARAAAVAPAGYDGAADRGSIAGGWTEPAPASAAAAPLIVQPQSASPRNDSGRATSAQVGASAPPGQGREQARIEGDVFLDGALVGRWMSDYLAREAGRASAGPTGFDARRNPLMPGATVGM